MDEPNNNLFAYNRMYPPLFFAVPTLQEAIYWQQSMSRLTREYFKVCKKNSSCYNILSNGMTTGEFAMHLITQNHHKRVRSIS